MHEFFLEGVRVILPRMHECFWVGSRLSVSQGFKFQVSSLLRCSLRSGQVSTYLVFELLS